MSPTIYREGPYRFFFNSREESRRHVHISSAQGTAKFWLEPIIALANYHGLRIKNLLQSKGLFRRTELSLSTDGISTSLSEVTNISHLGFWLWVEDKEYFVPFDDYPDFLKASIAEIYNLQQLGPGQFHWPDLDMDIELDALENPEMYSMQFKP
jgi:hypothetical protein